MKQFLITIFTPTYNRADALYDCYISLRAQTNNKFIWQIIDDGSTDNTENLVKEWKKNSDFEIVYYKVENGGKARAINKSLEETSTELWLCLDSDDTLADNAIDVIEKEYAIIKHNDNVCGLFSLRGKDVNAPMQGVVIPKHIQFSTQGFIRYSLGIKPEYAHVFKTKIARKYKYPSVPGENYFPLSYVFDQIDLEYCYKIIHKPIMICCYRKDGLTKNKRTVVRDNPIGYMIYKKQLVRLAPNRKEKYKAVSTYITGCLLSKKNPFSNNSFKFLTVIFFPVGLFDYVIRYKLGIKLDFEIQTKSI